MIKVFSVHMQHFVEIHSFVFRISVSLPNILQDHGFLVCWCLWTCVREAQRNRWQILHHQVNEVSLLLRPRPLYTTKRWKSLETNFKCLFSSYTYRYIPGCAEITYLFTCPFNLGKLKRIAVWHHGIFQSWGLDRVIVRPAWNRYRYAE